MISDIVASVEELKTVKEDRQAAIDALRKQYLIMQQTFDSYPFLQESTYIKHDLHELQELLVKGNYITPDELMFSQKHTDKFVANMDFRMERASEIFYEYVRDHHPEFLSPQHEKFIDAAVAGTVTPEANTDNYTMQETNNKLSLKSLSSILVGL